MKPEILTIGAYGFNENDFFHALINRGVDTFCDIRFRRGMRGAAYKFVNSVYLQQKLQELGLHYIHYKELAPGEEVRNRQKEDDKAQKVKKRTRLTLSQSFIQAYERDHLSDFDASAFVAGLGPEARKVVLFCVEREPEACHRSLLAKRLTCDLGIEVEHILP